MTDTSNRKPEIKDNGSSRIIQSVRKLFLSGGKFTAQQLNERVGFNDARKIISDLRHKEGWKIEDVRLDDGRKLYWLEPGKRQQELFETKTIGQVADESKNDPESLMYNISKRKGGKK